MDTGLFALVNSLSRSEKRYFKLNASVFRENNLLVVLFDMLVKQEQYDEKKILKELRHDNKHKQFSIAKKRLYELILKSMRSYHADKTVDHQLNNSLQDVSFLNRKKVGKEFVEKELRQIEAMAIKYEKHNYLLEALEMRLNLEEAAARKNILEKMRSILRKIENAVEYRLIHDTITAYYESRGNWSRKKEESAEMKKMINSDRMKDPALAITTVSKNNYYNSHFLYSRFIGDVKATYDICKAFVRHLEKEKYYVQENPRAYRMAMNNYLISQLECNKLDGFISDIEKFRSIPEIYPKADNKEFKTGLYVRMYTLLLEYYRNTFQYDNAIKLVPEIKEFIQSTDLSKEVAFEVTLYAFITDAYFTKSKFTEALFWLNKMLNVERKYLDTAMDIHAHARMMNLIIHFEIGNHETLESLVRSTSRFLKKEKKNYRFETEVIHFFEKYIVKTADLDLFYRSLHLLKTKLIDIIKDPLEEQFINYFDLIAWIDSKLNNKPFAQVIKEKRGNKK